MKFKFQNFMRFGVVTFRLSKFKFKIFKSKLWDVGFTLVAVVGKHVYHHFVPQCVINLHMHYASILPKRSNLY